MFGFLYSHAGVLKLLAIVDDLTRMLSQAGPLAALVQCHSMQSSCTCSACQQRGEALGCALCCANILCFALQMANSMAVSEGALRKDMAVLQVDSTVQTTCS